MSASARQTLWARLSGVIRSRTELAAPARRLRFALVEEEVARRGGDRPLRVLDAGCGDGLLSIALAMRHPSWRLLGVDIRNELLEGARDRARQRQLINVHFEFADLTRGLPEDGFEVVLAVECLEEIPDDMAALRVMASSLAPGGILVAHVPEQSWRAILPGSPSTWRDQVRQGYSAIEIANAVERAGLEVLCVQPTFHGTVGVAQELADRIKRRSPALRLLTFPLMVAAVALERQGVTWGRGRAVLVVGRRPGRPI